MPVPTSTSPADLARTYLNAARTHTNETTAVDLDGRLASLHADIGRFYRRMVNLINVYPDDAEAVDYLAPADKFLRDVAANPAHGLRLLSLAADFIDQAWATARVNAMTAETKGT